MNIYMSFKADYLWEYYVNKKENTLLRRALLALSIRGHQISVPEWWLLVAW